MGEKDVIAYAITHAPRGQKGGPYEAAYPAKDGTPEPSLIGAYREPVPMRERARELANNVLVRVRKVVPNARVIRIVRSARPSEAWRGGDMKLELHDANTGGPTATVTVDYEYQAEMWLDDIAADHPRIVRCVLDNGREWVRDGAKFVEVKS